MILRRIAESICPEEVHKQYNYLANLEKDREQYSSIEKNIFTAIISIYSTSCFRGFNE